MAPGVSDCASKVLGRTDGTSACSAVMCKSPVGIPDDAVHEVVVHEAEARDWRPQVEVNDVLLAYSPQRLAVTHPCQGIHYLLIPWQLDAKPVRWRSGCRAV